MNIFPCAPSKPKKLRRNDSPQALRSSFVIRKRNDDPFDVDVMELAMSLPGGSNEEASLEEVGDAIFDAMELRPKMEVCARDDVLERLGMETRLKENRIVDLREQNAPSGSSAAEKPEKAAK